MFNRVYSDKMLWDMSGDGNSACAFARTVCSDLVRVACINVCLHWHLHRD